MDLGEQRKRRYLEGEQGNCSWDVIYEIRMKKERKIKYGWVSGLLGTFESINLKYFSIDSRWKPGFQIHRHSFPSVAYFPGSTLPSEKFIFTLLSSLSHVLVSTFTFAHTDTNISD